MKPWEETWDVQPRGDAGGWRIYPEGEEECATFWEESGDRARLAAAAPEMARLLLEFYKIEDRGCFSSDCNGPFDDGTHDATCEVRIVLVKAGVLKGSPT